MGIISDIERDYRAIFVRDPAARSRMTVIMTYSGLHSMVMYRLAHALHDEGVPFFPSLLSTVTRIISGIEIHPAAKIGPGMVIDHGVGVVIGETAEIGADCLLYQGVTLGGTGKEQGKRHPTLGRGVTVGAGAKVLGNIRIGDYVKIGANSVVLKSVPDHSIVVGVPGRVIKKKVMRVEESGAIEVLEPVQMPDPDDERFRALEAQIAELRSSIERLEGKKSMMKIYNTMTGHKEEFVPLHAGKVGMYACGVTVYDVCHIGHARSAIIFDMMREYLKFKGYDVTFVKNFTDIDDKIINRATERGMAWNELAELYTQKYYEDMDRLGVVHADIEPKATEHIKEIIDLVQGLIDKGIAYRVEGDVYFEIGKYQAYGGLSGRNIEDMMAGARVDIDERKRNPMDFALWKGSKPGEPAWPSPWGAGRPGWHIECSAMSMKHLGKSIDIHGGGADLIFPHHENERAQTEAFTGEQFVKYWVHNGFITVDKEKMSKSLGNFFTIVEILEKFDPEVLRVFLLNTHYRSPIEFSDEQLLETEVMMDRYYVTVSRVAGFMERQGGKDKADGGADLEHATLGFRESFGHAMDDDFNTAMAIGHIFELVREINRFLDKNPSGGHARAVVTAAMDALRETGAVLRIFKRTPDEWSRDIMKVKDLGISEAEILEMIERRQEARDRKDWAEADTIRKGLESRGIVIEDKASGTVWRVRAGA